MLDAQAFRAARLVVDSGLHAFGWSRERAIEFMHERGSLPSVDAEIEVDRYTIWPGQALAYKIGQREIERARREVSEFMGDRFDLRDAKFTPHDRATSTHARVPPDSHPLTTRGLVPSRIHARCGSGRPRRSATALPHGWRESGTGRLRKPRPR